MRVLLALVLAVNLLGWNRVACAQATGASSGGAFDIMNGSILSDPLALPPGGQFYVTSGYMRGQESYDDFAASGGAAKSKVSSGSNSFDQELWYGVTPRLSLDVSENYSGVTRITQYLPNNGSGSYGAHGWMDPGFGVTWRALDQRFLLPADVDLTAEYSPNVIAAQIAPSGGSEALARQRASLGAAIGTERRNLSVQLAANAIYLGTAHVLDSSTDQTDVQNAELNYSLAVNSQTRLDSRSSINLDLGYDFDGNQRISHGSGDVFTVQKADALDLGTSFNYHLIPNRLVVFFGGQR